MTENQIDEYIRANRDRYNRATITNQLIAVGHDAAAIDQAWTASDAEVAAARGPNPWPRYWGTFLLSGLVGVVAVFLIWSGMGGFYSGSGYPNLAAIVFLVFLVVPLLVGAGIVALARRRVSPATLTAMAIWVPLVLVGLSAGSCIAIGVTS
jgi:hypothetical protein